MNYYLYIFKRTLLDWSFDYKNNLLFFAWTIFIFDLCD